MHEIPKNLISILRFLSFYLKRVESAGQGTSGRPQFPSVFSSRTVAIMMAE
jgi:hypothetical protein